jgi:hypothetical protein
LENSPKLLLHSDSSEYYNSPLIQTEPKKGRDILPLLTSSSSARYSPAKDWRCITAGDQSCKYTDEVKAQNVKRTDDMMTITACQEKKNL